MDALPRITVPLFLLLGLAASLHPESSRCYTSSSMPRDPLESENDAVWRGRCYAACVEKYAITAVSEVRSSGPSYLTFGLKQLDQSCDGTQKVLECQRGCIIKAEHPQHSRSECREECRSTCSLMCGAADTCNYEGSSCQQNCQKPPCGAGCNLISMMTMEGTQLSPHQPFPPLLNEQESAGLFDVVADQMGSGDGNNVTVFIFKIDSPTMENRVTYVIQYGLTDPLNLEQYACKKVNISMAAVNAYGKSMYSSLTELSIHGERRYPSQLSNVAYQWAGDSRSGYDENAEIILSWDRPQGFEYVTSYNMTIFIQSEQCGAVNETPIEIIYSFHKNATKFVWSAKNPNKAPLIGCRLYIFRVQVQPAMDGQYTQVAADLSNLAFYSGVPPSMVLRCSRDINDTTGMIIVIFEWKVMGFSFNSRPIHESIDHYKLYSGTYDVVSSVIPHLRGQVWYGEVIAKNNTATYTYVLPEREPSSYKDDQIRITVEPVTGGNSRQDGAPERQNCFISAAPEPPTPIDNNNIVIDQSQMDNRHLFLKLSWQQPNASHGNITEYEVRITRQPLSQHDEPSMSFAVAYKGTLMLTGGYGIVDTDNIYLDNDILCLYAQIRSMNTYLWSEWSRPVLLVRYPDEYPNCTAESIVNTKDPSQESATAPMVPLYAYFVAGGGACAIIFVIFVLVVGIILIKKCRTRQEMKRVFMGGCYHNSMFWGVDRNSTKNSSFRHVSGSMKSSLMDGIPKPDEWEIPQSSIVAEEPLGEGCFGEVRKGVVKGPLPVSRMMKKSICVTVAVKYLKASATGGERTDFLHEIDMMKNVANGSNPHVINLIGCVTIQEPLCLITEYIQHGDLLSYLQTIRKMIAHRPQQPNVTVFTGLLKPEPYLEPLSPQESSSVQDQVVVLDPSSAYADLGEVEPVNLICFAYQIASGMNYLSSLDIVHRDLACRNILVGEGKMLKISDFGMSRVVACDDVYVKTSKGRLPWKWMATESILNREFTTASDVWSYGVVLWEIATVGGFPYPMITNSELLEYLTRGSRLECPENCSREIYDIMLNCWREDPTERPSFTKLRATFDAMLAEDNPYIQFDNINVHKPYYHQSNSSDSDDVKMGISDEESSTDSYVPSSVPVPIVGGVASTYDRLNPVIDTATNNHLEELKRPIANTYVDTPSKPYDSMFNLETAGTECTVDTDCESYSSSDDFCETAV